MTDAEQKLRATLSELYEELESIEHPDDEIRGLLENTVEEIHAKLEPTKESTTARNDEHEYRSIIDRLGHVAEHFEQTHPTLSSIVGRLADVLSQMGI